MARPRRPVPRKSRAESAAETRAELVRAGLELFAQDGLDAPSLDAICARAGKTRGAFYVHFADRDHFLEAVMAEAGASYLDAIVGPALDGDEAPSLLTIVQRFVRSVRTGAYPLTRAGGPRPHQLLDACARSEAVRTRYVALIERAEARLRSALARARAEAIVGPSVEPALASKMLMATVIGAQTLIELGVPLDVPRSAAQLMALLGAGPRNSAPAGPSAERARRVKRAP